jgi:transglutaminase-like putative cysteine protease
VTPRVGSALTALAGLAALAVSWTGPDPRGDRWHDPALVLATVLGFVLVGLLWVSRTIANPRATALVAGLLLLAVSAGRDDVALLPCWLAFAVSLPLALAPGPVPVSVATGLSSVVFGSAVVLFLALPRLGDPAALDLATGFAPAVELDAFEHLEDDPTVVLTGTVDPRLPGRVWWRGLALDTFDGRTWTASAPAVSAFPNPTEGEPAHAVRVSVTSVDPTGVLFLPGRAWSFADVTPGTLAGDPLDGWRIVPAGPVRYEAVVSGPSSAGAWFPPQDEPANDVHLTLPPLDPRVAELAARVGGEGTPSEQVGRLAAWLRENAAYTRRAPAHGDAVAAFLFDDRAGHCELFATALAVLARTEGIPSRLVTGFAAPVGPGGEVEVRRADAHAWVEILDPAVGWVPFDATPVGAPRVTRTRRPVLRLGEGWRRTVLAWSHEDQVAVVRQAGGALATVGRLAAAPRGWPVAAVAALGLATALALVVRRRRPARFPLRTRAPNTSSSVARMHDLARAAVADAGFSVPPGLPPVAASHWLAERAPGPAADALEALAWLTYEVELGGAPGGPLVEPARELLARVRLVPPVIRPAP